MSPRAASGPLACARARASRGFQGHWCRRPREGCRRSSARYVAFDRTTQRRSARGDREVVEVQLASEVVIFLSASSEALRGEIVVMASFCERFHPRRVPHRVSLVRRSRILLTSLGCCARNWVLFGPDAKELPLLGGGSGSVDELRECAMKHQDVGSAARGGSPCSIASALPSGSQLGGVAPPLKGWVSHGIGCRRDSSSSRTQPHSALGARRTKQRPVTMRCAPPRVRQSVAQEEPRRECTSLKEQLRCEEARVSQKHRQPQQIAYQQQRRLGCKGVLTSHSWQGEGG